MLISTFSIYNFTFFLQWRVPQDCIVMNPSNNALHAQWEPTRIHSEGIVHQQYLEMQYISYLFHISALTEFRDTIYMTLSQY